MIANKSLIIFLSIFLINSNFIKVYGVEPDEIITNPAQEFRARNISKNIRCMVCQNQSIDDSSAPLAKDLRLIIRNKIKEGKKDKEIYKFLTDRYGDFILLKPPLKLNTFILWFLPILFIAIGIIVVFFHNKKSNKL